MSEKKSFNIGNCARIFSRRTVLSLVGSGIGASMTHGIVSGSDISAENSQSAGSLRITGTPNGHFFVDEHDRTVILHGVNVGKKTAPFIRPESEFNAGDIERIRSWGFNVVRLGVIWEGIEPTRGEIDGSYLDRVEELVRQFTDSGIHVFIDMHQDLYSREFDGDGAPSWAVDTGWFDFDRSSPWAFDYADPAVARAFDHFWQNDHELQEEFARSYAAVARRVGEIDGVIGYELFNEPAPGITTVYKFEQRHLRAFYNRITRALRAEDSSTPIWVEPNAPFNHGVSSSLSGLEADELVFSFHNYAGQPAHYIGSGPWNVVDSIGKRLYKRVMRKGRKKADGLGAVPILTEYCPGNNYEETAYIADLADQYMTGWTYWEYKNSGTRTSGTAGTMADHEAVVDRLVRPYPPAIAGVPQEYGFNRDSGRFTLRYAPTNVGRKTVLFVPDRQYPDGYQIDVGGGSVASTNGQYVRLGHDSSNGEIAVEIKPA